MANCATITFYENNVFFYRSEPSISRSDFDPHGFEWVDCSDSQHSILSLLRHSATSNTIVLGVFNFTPVPRTCYQVGVPRAGAWQAVLNSDAKAYGGSDMGNMGALKASPGPFHGRPHMLQMTLPPLAAVFFRHGG